MQVSDIQTLYAYNRWANLRLFSAIEKLNDEQFHAAVPGSFPSVRETLFHILAAEWIWLKRWTGASPRASRPAADVSDATWKGLTAGGVPTVQELGTLAALRSFCDLLEQERNQFLSALSEETLHAPLQFHDMAGTPYSEPLLHLMQHLVNHGTYHRGQVISMLRQLKAETVALDMLYFFRESGATAASAG